MNTSQIFPRKIRSKTLVQLVACLSFILLLTGMLSAQTASPPATTCAAPVDPGPQVGSGPDAGGPLAGLNSTEVQFWLAARTRFQTVFSVSGTISGEPGVGLGPAFNGNQCSMCHSQPAIGGTSPGPTSPENPTTNPQIPLATLDGATNTVPFFVTLDGPTREARFILKPDGTQDGGVHEIYTIKGRTDAQSCKLQQPDFSDQTNIINRIPTPLFGLGLVENLAVQDLQNNLISEDSAAATAGVAPTTGTNGIPGNGIAGSFNVSGNDGTITKFGWKAQNPTMLVFAGEAENSEMGITNELFADEKFPNKFPQNQPSVTIASCDLNPTPEDITNGITGPPPGGPSGDEASDISSDSVNFAGFMLLNAPPAPITTFPLSNGGTAADVATGKGLFKSIGCSLCHTEQFTTQPSPFGAGTEGAGLNEVTFNPFSDFALHHMGSNLADGITQGLAGPDEFRTAPLWGLAQRLFFLHDGRTTDLLATIEFHASNPTDCVVGTLSQQFEVIFDVQGISEVSFDPTTTDEFCGSEANPVITAFNALSNCQQQDVLDYLRTL
ncbi:MAG TPA: di-heme oxidoredictase family protein [Blastocatellia bacterium]